MQKSPDARCQHGGSAVAEKGPLDEGARNEGKEENGDNLYDVDDTRFSKGNVDVTTDRSSLCGVVGKRWSDGSMGCSFLGWRQGYSVICSCCSARQGHCPTCTC